jgi:histidine triad (HIT) family protein
MTESSCLFCRVARGEIPARLAYENDDLLAFHDIDPKAPTHVLVIPRKHIGAMARVEDTDASLMGALLLAARDIARELGVEAGGYRLVINNGADAGQSVDHVHLHILGGRKMTWPPG